MLGRLQSCSSAILNIVQSFLKLKRYNLFTLGSLILLILNLYAAKALEEFGSPLLFALALLVEIVLAGVFIYGLIRSLATPENILKSLVISAWKHLATNVYVKKLVNSKSPILLWIRQRLRRGSPYGLALTVTLLTAALLFIGFMGVLNSVVSQGAFTQTDTRILNLMPSIRTPTQTTFFRFITFLANTQTAILFMVVAAAIFWRKRQKLLAAFVVFVASGEEAVTFVLKHLVKRMRPDEALGLIREDSYSFPSGHVVRATVLFGLLAYFIFKSCRSAKARVLTITIYILAVFLVALSRVYLGVHYPTDVWGSVLLGGAMLALVVGVLEISSRYNLARLTKVRIINKELLAVPPILAIFALIAAPFFVRIQPVSFMPGYMFLPAINENTIKKLPLYSETITGGRMEPISFIYVGYEEQIITAFQNHGWYRADPSTVANTLKAVAISFQGRQYPTAPVSPSFLNPRPEDVAFEQPAASNSLRQRHHTRLWRTGYALADGRPIWVATASFDDGIKFAGTIKLPTHHIDPNIDGEREYIVKSLGVTKVTYLQAVDAQLGKNASGDAFFTDGKAVLVELE